MIGIIFPLIEIRLTNLPSVVELPAKRIHLVIRFPVVTCVTELLLQCILSIFPASVHQFYVNILVNINPFLYINNQFALIDRVCQLTILIITTY